MEIRGTSSIQAAQAVRAPSNVGSVDKSQAVSHPNVVDQLDISAEAQAASQLGDGSDIRSVRVAEIKAQIADGTYETQQNLEVAVDRMLDELV